MSELNHQTGRAIDARRQALAQAVVARQYERQPELVARYGEAGRGKCVEDTSYHLAYLSAAIAASSPTLFADYLAWAKVVMTAYRVRQEDVVTNLVCLRDVLREVFTEEMGCLAADYVESGLKHLQEAPAVLPTLLDPREPLAALARGYLDALLRCERQAAGRLVLDAVQKGLAVQDVYLHVFQRCQREIGRLWQMNQLSVAQEHYCTAATQLIMAQLYPYVFAGPKHGRRLVAVCVGGELHEIGLRIVSDFFELEGWDTFYLGASTPTPGAVRTVVERQAHVLAVSATMTFHLPAVAGLVRAVRSSPECAGVKILVGGYPLNADPGLWRKLGADSHAPDARGAPALADDLIRQEGRP